MKPNCFPVPHRDPGSLENRPLPSQSTKATTQKDIIWTLGQPAMEEKPTYSFIVGTKQRARKENQVTKLDSASEWRLEGSGGSLDPGTQSSLSP